MHKAPLLYFPAISYNFRYFHPLILFCTASVRDFFRKKTYAWIIFIIFLFHSKKRSVSNNASFLGLEKGTEMTSLIVAGASVNTTILSDNNNASSILCVMNKIDCSCCSQLASNHFCISIRVNSSNAEKGSSKQSICWGLNNARIKEARCLIPPDSS